MSPKIWQCAIGVRRDLEAPSTRTSRVATGVHRVFEGAMEVDRTFLGRLRVPKG